MDRLLTIDDLAAALRTTPSTVRYWRHLGTGPAAVKVGRRVLFRESDVAEWIASKSDSRAVAG